MLAQHCTTIIPYRKLVISCKIVGNAGNALMLFYVGTTLYYSRTLPHAPLLGSQPYTDPTNVGKTLA